MTNSYDLKPGQVWIDQQDSSRYGSITISAIGGGFVYFKWGDGHETKYPEKAIVGWLKEYNMVLTNGKFNNFSNLYNKLTS